MAEQIIHELPVPQSVQDLRAACGLPAVTVRHGDEVHQFAYTTQPEYVTCVGCLAVREVTAARTALGECWLTGGLSLAQGIARKMRGLEGLEPAAAAAWKVVDAVQAAHHDDVLPRLRDLAGAAIAAALAPPELTPADPMLPTVAVPRDLVQDIVDDLRQGLAIERETGEALAELLGATTTPQPDEHPGEPEPGTPIAKCSCPCCGARLEVEHGDEPGQVAVLGERARIIAQPLDQWCDDDGPVLWWKLPVCEPPWAGSPLDDDWPGYHTHWTPIVVPEEGGAR